MNPSQQNNLIAWIAKLLSGNYKQGTHDLYNSKTDCYCANGVLAGPVAEFPYVSGQFFFGSQYDSLITPRGFNNSFLPAEWFYKFTGLHVPHERIAEFNDKGVSFVDIAIYLISYLPDGPRKEHMQYLAIAKKRALADLTCHSDEEAEGEAA
jgi:hypothetical protein